MAKAKKRKKINLLEKNLKERANQELWKKLEGKILEDEGIKVPIPPPQMMHRHIIRYRDLSYPLRVFVAWGWVFILLIYAAIRWSFIW